MSEARIFTPSDAIDMAEEKHWGPALGMLDWDETNIIFTKRSLIEFLKYTGTTVDTNFMNIQKLPRYAKFGKIGGLSSEEAPTASSESGAALSASTSDPRRVGVDDVVRDHVYDDALGTAPLRNAAATSTSDSTAFRPTRRVREPPGGVDHFFGADDTAPRADESVRDNEHADGQSSNIYRPSRRVRDTPGGPSSIGNLWDAPEESVKSDKKVKTTGTSSAITRSNYSQNKLHARYLLAVIFVGIIFIVVAGIITLGNRSFASIARRIERDRERGQTSTSLLPCHRGHRRQSSNAPITVAVSPSRPVVFGPDLNEKPSSAHSNTLARAIPITICTVTPPTPAKKQVVGQ
ncbi:hypothetical protein FISHEDRAFT_71424 [Fistulina hepatica ATCC 64428]|nr:hypothetical protein FISHEDRAFT_71424 [Fistulina hepatica ATCC 64428]